jgi:CBS domain-containing protein
MAHNPRSVGLDASLVEVARIMRDDDVGDVLVTQDDSLRGIVTDRDIVVRAVAEGANPSDQTVDAVFSGGEVVTVTPDTSLEQAALIMREHAIRRLAVVEGGRPVGVVSLGDLAMQEDEDSALAEISSTPPNA